MSKELIVEARRIVEDLRAPNAGRYMVDGTVSALVGWGAIAFAVSSETPMSARVAAIAIGAAAMYRGLAFIHELFHQQHLRAFRWVWHALVGVPLLLPLLLYLPVHQGHHSSSDYGTSQDGEYEQFNGRRAFMSWRLVLLNLLLPMALWVRFAVLTPLGMLVPKVKQELIPVFVHLSLRMPYKAPPIRGAAAAEASRVELACMVWAWVVAGATLAGHLAIVIGWAIALALVATLNTVRALCSTHLYVEWAEGRDTLGQLADSINVGGNGLLTKLLCPVGLQYHALHHLAPYLPYHALPEAHRRLMSQLPPDSLYHRVTVPGLYEGWRRLVKATEGAADPAVSRTAPS